MDHSVGVVLQLVAGDEVDEGQVWANVHHSSNTSYLPLRLHRMMDSAIALVDIENKEELFGKQKSCATEAGEKFCVKQQKSKISRILMKDEDV